jgi:Domain of unknown function (DUF4134)
MNLLQFTVRSDANGLIKEAVSKPINENYVVFERFAFVILALLGLGIAFRIYRDWNMGQSEDIYGRIAKWFGGIILVIALLKLLETLV